ncbi:MAG: FlgD immunoglobulin-like domain containing protein [Candidatus Latescibacterota bacterium]
MFFSDRIRAPAARGPPPALIGYEALRFDFSAGTAAVAVGATARFDLTLAGQTTDLLTRVDLAVSEWQQVTLLLEPSETGWSADLQQFTLTGNLQGTFHLRDVRLVRRMPPVSTAVAEEQRSGRPQGFALRQNYPNPFNSGTTIEFDLPEATLVELAVYNLAGQQVATLVRGQRPAGAHRVSWDGRSDTGRPLATGVCLYRLRAGERVENRRLLLLR